MPLAFSASIVAKQSSPVGVDQKWGERIATSGLPNGVAACSSCHGQYGEGNSTAGFPRLAGQASRYSFRQLTAFADGSRQSAVMTPIAKGLSPVQMQAVARYYAEQRPPTAAPPVQVEQRSSRGRILVNSGDNGLMLQACANCHGPDGIGEPPLYPYLAGQNATYLANALQAWKVGSRKTDTSQQMPIIARQLSNEDIAAVANYFASLPAPGPESSLTSTAMPASAKQPRQNKQNSGGPKAATPMQGAGMEQGGPTTGGSQGPGGGGGASGSGASGNQDGGTP